MNRPMRLLSGLVLLALFVVPANIFSCSNLVENRFVSKRMPEVPQQSYINGKLGLLWPTFERRYLAIAYRYLDGKPLSAGERDSLIKGTTPILIPGGMAPPDTPVALWLKARSRALGLKDVQQIEIQTWKMNGFNGYPNCGDDTFTKAAATVADRAQKFGVGSAAIQDWVSAQDAVFLNCGSADELRWHPPDQPPPPKVLHEPPPATLNNALLKFDRQYQVAAANFYYGDFATAAGGFEAIAREPESPWRTLAPYLVARSYIRKATLNTTGDQTFDSGAMHEAEKQLQAILADKSLASVHSAAQSLLDYVEARLYPEQRLHALALVLDAGVGDRMNTKLFDYTYLLDHVRDQLSQTESVQQAIREHTRNPADDFEGAALVEGWRSAARKAGDFDDLTDWVQTFQLDTAVSKEYRYERWQATKSLPWLLSALVSAHSDDTLAADIATAAASIAPDSPAYDTALYHRVRLLLEQDRHDPARKLLDANLQRIEALPPADRNPFLAQRFALAQNFQEFLRFAHARPSNWRITSARSRSTATTGAATIASARPPHRRLHVYSSIPSPSSIRTCRSRCSCRPPPAPPFRRICAVNLPPAPGCAPPFSMRLASPASSGPPSSKPTLNFVLTLRRTTRLIHPPRASSPSFTCSSTSPACSRS